MIVFERDFTIVDGTAGATNRNAINDNNPDFPPILVDAQTLIAIVT